MKERLKELRSALQLSQKEFSQRISIGYSTLAMLETGDRTINDRHIKLICNEFDVNEHWFRTGEGEMFNHTANSLIDKLCEEKHLGELERKLFQAYFEIDPKVRTQFILQLSNRLLASDELNPAERETFKAGIADYRKAMEASTELAPAPEQDPTSTNSSDDPEIEAELEEIRWQLILEKRAKEESSSFRRSNIA